MDAQGDKTTGSAFARIYETHEWGGGSLSGPGSDPERTREYRETLQQVLRKYDVRSVVDLGCGDWASSHLIDWTGIDYLGLDVVPVAIEHCRKTYGRPGIRFEVFDIASQQLPSADLLICKEVLQHLPNSLVHSVLAQLDRFRLAVLVNDLNETYHPSWFRRTRTVSLPPNADIPTGAYRPLKLTSPPFDLNARCLLTYQNRLERKGWLKECLLWENPSRS